MKKLPFQFQAAFSPGIDSRQDHRIVTVVSTILSPMICPLKHLALCAVLCLTCCGGKQGASPAPSDQSHQPLAVDEDEDDFPSESALHELDNIPLTPATLKMSTGDFLKHVQEVLSTKRNVMLRIIATPSTFGSLADLMKEPCEAMILTASRPDLLTESHLLAEVCATIGTQYQYDYATVFLRFRDEAFCAQSRIGNRNAKHAK
jgi:hypothetical protein